ncbi:MAG: hypothetical protein KBD41_08645 [Saprospiraceae bacterium]|nr:hypothetical protein [Saprospiraceae bacterium]MBP9745442.1 hypothetical protein [Saprospiraceae bacterium]
MNRMNQPKTSQTLLFLCGLILLLMSVTSQGYFHWDEHFQLLEFANYKSGLAKPEGLAWEFHEQIRPGLQPFIAYTIMSLNRALGIQDPFFIAFILRLLSGIMSLMVIILYTRLIIKELPSSKSVKTIFISLAGFLWFCPFLLVRFSSENWSSLFFFGGIYFLMNSLANSNTNRFFPIFMAGLLLSLAFQFRFQIAFAGLGIVAWLINNKSLKLKGWSYLSVGALLGLIIGFLCDYWLYGSWQLTSLKYFDSNVIKGMAASFGISPWYAYFPLVFNALGPVLNIVLIAFFMIGLFSNRKHFMVWIIIPFVVAHLVTSHKELRFMFPMLIPFLYLITLGAEKTFSLIKLNLPVKLVMGSVCIFNLFLLVVRIMGPADPHILYYRYIFNQTKSAKPVVIFYTESNMFGPSGLRMTFYRPPNLLQLEVQNPFQLDTYDTSLKNAFIFSDGVSTLIKPDRKTLRAGFTADYWSLPSILETKKLEKASSNWSLYKLD